jgi:hypothetical protein
MSSIQMLPQRGFSFPISQEKAQVDSAPPQRILLAAGCAVPLWEWGQGRSKIWAMRCEFSKWLPSGNLT